MIRREIIQLGTKSKVNWQSRQLVLAGGGEKALSRHVASPPASIHPFCVPCGGVAVIELALIALVNQTEA